MPDSSSSSADEGEGAATKDDQRSTNLSPRPLTPHSARRHSVSSIQQSESKSRLEEPSNGNGAPASPDRASSQTAVHSEKHDMHRPQSHHEDSDPDLIDQLVVERGNKFHVIDANDVNAVYESHDDQRDSSEERHRDRNSDDDSDRENRLRVDDSNNGHQRATSSLAVNGNNRPSRQSTPQSGRRPERSKSAYATMPVQKTSSESTGNKKWMYRMSGEEKERLLRQKAKKQEQEQLEREKKEKEEQRKKAECDAAFHEWLKRKRDEAAQHRRERREQRIKDEQKRNEQKDEGKDAFAEWMKVKRQQEKKAVKAEEEQDKDATEDAKIRSKKDGERAFRKWLRKKRREARLARGQCKSAHPKRKTVPPTVAAC